MNTVTADFKLEIYDAPTTTWTDITQYVLVGTLQIDHELNARSVMTFSLYDDADVLTVPSVGQQVRVSDVKSGSRAYYFGGQLNTIEYAQLALGKPYRIDCKCQDWSFLLDRYYVTAAYTNQSSAAIVTDLIAGMDSQDQLTVTLVNGDTGPVIATMNVPTITIQEALDELARETGYKYRVSYDKKLYWFAKSASAASWDLTEANALTHVYGIPMVTRDRAQYRNVQEIRGVEKPDDAFQFYPPSGQNGLIAIWGGFDRYGYNSPPVIDFGRPISEVSIVYVGRNAREVTPDENDIVDGGMAFTAGPKGSDNLFYWVDGDQHLYVNESYVSKGENTTYYAYEYFPINGIRWVWADVKFMNKPGAMMRKNSEWCTQQGIAEQDTIEQNAAIEGGSGIIYKLEIDDRLTTNAECEEKANALLKEYGTIPTVVQYESDDWTDLEVGQLQHVSIYGLDKDCVVRAIRITDVSGLWLRAEIELVGSEKQGFAQYWRAISGGQTARMQSTYQIRPTQTPNEFRYMEAEDLVLDEVLTATEITPGTTWGDYAIGAGAEWA